MKILIKSISGQDFTLELTENIQVEELKIQIETKLSIPTNAQKLIFRGRVLVDGHTLEHYKVEDGSVIHLVRIDPRVEERSQQPPPQQQNRRQRPNVSILGLQAAVRPFRRVTNSSSGGNQVSMNQLVREVESIRTLENEIRDPLNQLSQMLNQPSLGDQERENIRNLSETLGPTISRVSSRYQALNTMLSNLNVPQTGDLRTNTRRPSVNSIHVHVHAHADELDELPDRISRLEQRLNIPRRQRSSVTQGQTTITILGEDSNVPNPILQRYQNQNQQNQSGNQRNQSNLEQNQANSEVPTSLANSLQNLLGASSGNAGNTGNINVNNIMQAVSGILQNTQLPEGMNLTTIAGSLGTNTNVGSVIHNISERMGMSGAPGNTAEELLEVFFNHINISDLMGMMQGNWGAVDRAIPDIRKYFIEKVLKGDSSPTNRNVHIEKALQYCREHAKKNSELLEIINGKCTSFDDLFTEIEGVLRTYLKIVFDVLIDGIEKLDHPIIKPNGNTPYGDALQKMVTLLIGDLTIVLDKILGEETRNQVLTCIAKKVLANLPRSAQLGMFSQLGAGLFLNFWKKEFASYQSTYPNRNPQVTLVPNNNNSTESRPQSTTQQQPESSQPSSASTNTGNGFPFQISNFMQGIASSQQNSPSNPPTGSQTDPNRWKEGLSEGEQKMIEEILREDLIEMSMNPDGKQQLSQIYQSDVKQSGQTIAREDSEEELPTLERESEDSDFDVD